MNLPFVFVFLCNIINCQDEEIKTLDEKDRGDWFSFLFNKGIGLACHLFWGGFTFYPVILVTAKK
jgi:hypothetical protein